MRDTPQQYRRSVLILVTIYVALMLLEWPSARHAANLPLKFTLALLPVIPVIPVIGVIWLIGRRVARSDELEQRVHLIALSIATGLVAILSLIGGFLSAAQALDLDGDILIWVFPVLCVTFGLARWLVGRRYGGSHCE